jgi:L-threonylcarbamoyladenylate synthase
LGARVFDESAVRRIFVAKGRPSNNPLIVHCAEKADVERVSEPLEKSQQRLFDALYTAFCPGALTILLPKHPSVLDAVTAGLETVAVRFPAHSLAQALIRAVGEPLVAPSANRSGYPSPTTAQHVMSDLEGRIAGVIDGGACSVGIESTVVNILTPELTILRPGSITKEQLDGVAVEQGFTTFVYATDSDNLLENMAPQSPGMKYRHYAPNADVLLASSLEEAQQLALVHPPAQILARSEYMDGASIIALSEQSLYAALRNADAAGCRTVIILCDEEVQKNVALMNRITKAASKR